MSIIPTLRERFSPSLSIKLTAYFVIFGFIIGYLSFIIVTSVSSQKTMEMTASTLVHLMQNITEVQGGELVDTILNRQHAGFARLFRHLERHTNTDHENVRTSFYYQQRTEQVWRLLVLDKNFFRARPAGHELTNSLNIAAKHRLYTTARLFMGRSDNIAFFVKVPLRSNRYTYVLKIDLDRQGALVFVQRNIHLFIVFDLILLAASLLLGKFFTHRIVKPIRALSDTASRRADGESGKAFAMDRRDEIGALSRSLNTMAGKIDAHVREIEHRMRVMETMNMIDKAVLSSISRSDLLDRVMGIVSNLFRSSSIALALYHEDPAGFDVLTMHHDTTRGMLAERPFVPLDELDPDHAANITSLYQFTCPHNDAGEPEIYAHCCGRVLNVPVTLGDAYLGSLIIGKDDGGDFSLPVTESAALLADQVGVALQSVKAFEEKERLLVGILLALTRSIDAKSKWTAGHSERVAKYAEAIGIRMGISDEDLRALTFSAILHDIGKIAVAESILDKSTRLSEAEYAIIQTHPRVGARIIADIPSYNRITPGVLYHHEHWDGSGYPDGLRGNTIPLASRIITVADVFDAVTADRPYRSGMGPDAARTFMRENSGILFDPEIVVMFLSIHENEMQAAEDSQ